MHRLLEEGYEVVGIDNDGRVVREAIEEGLPVVLADWLEFDDAPHDALFFGSSLHHMVPLAAVVEHAHDLLHDSGFILAEEFAVEDMNPATAAWFYGLDSMLQAAGILEADPQARPDIADPLPRWVAEHDMDPPLNTGAAMTTALGRWFELDRIEGAPFLYRDLCARLVRSEEGVRIGRRVLEMEIAGNTGAICNQSGCESLVKERCGKNRADRKRRT
jgi:SAM-dependent methyltransferase